MMDVCLVVWVCPYLQGCYVTYTLRIGHRCLKTYKSRIFSLRNKTQSIQYFPKHISNVLYTPVYASVDPNQSKPIKTKKIVLG